MSSFLADIKESDCKAYTQLLLENQSFAYKTLEAGDPEDTFHSPLIAELLRKAHLMQVHGWVGVPALKLRSKNEYGVRGALALCVTVVFFSPVF